MSLSSCCYGDASIHSYWTVNSYFGIISLKFPVKSGVIFFTKLMMLWNSQNVEKSCQMSQEYNWKYTVNNTVNCLMNNIPYLYFVVFDSFFFFFFLLLFVSLRAPSQITDFIHGIYFEIKRKQWRLLERTQYFLYFFISLLNCIFWFIIISHFSVCLTCCALT